MKKSASFFLVVFSMILVTSCGSNPYSKTNRMHKRQAKFLSKQLRTFPPEQGGEVAILNFAEDWVGTTNFNLRKPNYVIIHHTAQDSVEQTLRTFTLPRTSVSSHYVISDDGEIYQMLNDYYRGWHAGVGKWGNNTDLNSSSIGIELDNNGFEPFSEAQIKSLIDLLGVLKERHGIPTANFIGHSDIAPSRKVDPNVNFPWERLAEEGYGYWYDETAVTPDILEDSIPDVMEDNIPAISDNTRNRSLLLTEAEVLENSTSLDSITLTINPELALRVIGYDTSDLEAAIKAFKLHFIQEDVNAILTDEDLKILYNLARKYMEGQN